MGAVRVVWGHSPRRGSEKQGPGRASRRRPTALAPTAPFSEHEKGAAAGPAPAVGAAPRAGPRMTVLLSVQGLTKGFGPRPLFTDLSLDLRAGERVGLIGPNGSGKSTLLQTAGRPRGARRRHPLAAPHRPPRLPRPGRRFRPRPDRPRRAARRPRRRADRGPRTRNPRRHHAHPGRLHRSRPAGRRPLRRLAQAAGPGPRTGPPARPAAARRADQPPRPARHRLAGTAAAGRPLRLPRRHPRPGLSAGRRRRGHRDQPRLSRRLLPRRRLLRRLRRAARGVPGGPGPPRRSRSPTRSAARRSGWAARQAAQTAQGRPRASTTPPGGARNWRS